MEVVEEIESNALAKFLFPAPAPRSVAGILGWWEARRLKYNVVVGSAGMVSWSLAQLSMWILGETGDGGLLWQPVVAFGVLANVCYLMGPAVEILAHKIWGGKLLPVGPSLFRMGLTFSVGLALFPSLVIALLMVVRLVLWVL